MIVGVISLTSVGINRSNIIRTLRKQKGVRRHLISVNIIGNSRVAIFGGTPLKSPIRIGIGKYTLTLHVGRTTVVSITIRSWEKCVMIVRGTTGVGVTLTNGPGYNGAAVFGGVANTGRRINGCPNIAIRGGRNRHAFGNGSLLFISLPNACDLATQSLSRIITHGIVVGRGPSVVIGILSTSGLRHGLCLTTRLIRLNQPVIVTLGVVSVTSHVNVGVSFGGLKRRLNTIIIPLINDGGVNAGRLLSTVSNARAGSLIGTGISCNPSIRPTVTGLASTVRGVNVVGCPIH